MADPQIGAGRRGLAEKAFEVEARVGELRRGIGDEFGFFGVKRLDIGFDLGQEPSLASLHERRDARNQKRIVPRRGSVWVLDNPFGVMMLAGLGKRVLFAGDHKQLSPMVQSRSDDARRWMGRSPFGYLNLSVAVKNVLEEQSRMAPEICRTVSDLFYDGQLRVAKKEAADAVRR